ncbi:hypothetical protein [Haloarchaeobius baliensis]|uniref:hypothetical protein n=1 Tax=Haloarchaeobius baliensis TaxID=1670458 RepID=UPI003F8809E4
MATSRPQQPFVREPATAEWYGRLAQRLGIAVSALALAVAAVTGAAIALEAGSAGTALSRLVTVAAADPATLPALAVACHYGLVGVVVGCWFLGLGFILTGFFE